MSQPNIHRYLRHGPLPQLHLFAATARLGGFTRAAQGGMCVIAVERYAAGAGASGVNAGTLSLQIKRVALMRTEHAPRAPNSR